MSQLVPSAGLLIGGRYRLLQRIGGGGTSEVYRSEELGTGRDVALKLLQGEHARDEDITARFFQEAQAVNRIHHPNVVEVLETGHGETGPYIAMEYLRGRSTAAVLSEHGRLSLGAATSVLLPVLDALSASHAAGVVHRDVKPENVFIARTNSDPPAVKLLDFGIAKQLLPSSTAPRTSTGVVFGTPEYLSPEQANGQLDIDGRSDLFAVAVLLFEFLTGRRPFQAPTALATAYKVAHGKTPTLRDHSLEPNADLERLLERAMRKLPDDRFQSAEEMANALERLAPPQAMRDAQLRELLEPRSGGAVSSRPPRRTPTRPRSPVPNDTPTASRALATPPPGGLVRRPLRTVSQPRVQAAAAALPNHLRERRDEARTSVPPPVATNIGMRALPSRFVGKCHVRGLVLASVDSWVVRQYGDDVRARALDALAPEHAQEFRGAVPIQGIVNYDLEAVTAYFDALTSLQHRGQTMWARIAGSSAAGDGELASMLRPARIAADLTIALRRLVPVCSRLFDFGSWEVSGENGAAQLRITDLEPLSLPVRLWLVGLLEGSLRGRDSRSLVGVARGESPFAPHLWLDISSR